MFSLIIVLTARQLPRAVKTTAAKRLWEAEIAERPQNQKKKAKKDAKKEHRQDAQSEQGDVSAVISLSSSV